MPAAAQAAGSSRGTRMSPCPRRALTRRAMARANTPAANMKNPRSACTSISATVRTPAAPCSPPLARAPVTAASTPNQVRTVTMANTMSSAMTIDSL